MINFVKQETVLKTVPLSYLDPFSLETYEHILKISDIYLCMLICENSSQIYLLEDIKKLRYEIEYNTIHVYLLKDPISREVVKDIYLKKKNFTKKGRKLYLKMIIFYPRKFLINL